MVLSIFDRERRPVSMLTSAQIAELAQEFRDMALKARPPMAQSLSILAIRYARLAAQRELEERLPTNSC